MDGWIDGMDGWMNRWDGLIEWYLFIEMELSHSCLSKLSDSLCFPAFLKAETQMN
jgi:hypothetical protein